MLNTFYNYLIKPYKNKNILAGKSWHYLVILFLVVILNIGMIMLNLFSSQTRENFKVQFYDITKNIPQEYTTYVNKCLSDQTLKCDNYVIQNNEGVSFSYITNEGTAPEIDTNKPSMTIYKDNLFLTTGSTYSGIYKIDKQQIKTLNQMLENGSLNNLALPIILRNTVVIVLSIVLMTLFLVFAALSLLKFTYRFKDLKFSDIFKITVYSTNIGTVLSAIVFAINKNYIVAITVFISVFGINAFLNVLYTFIRNTPEQRKRIDEQKYL